MLVTAGGLRERGYDARIVTIRGPADLDDRARKLGIPVVNAGHAGVLGGLVGRVRLIRSVRRLQPDVVYSFMPAANITTVVGRPLWGRARVVWGIRDSGMQAAVYGWKSRLTNRVADRLAGFPDRIVANSFSARSAYIARGYPAERFDVIPNGIDTEEFYPDQRLREKERSTGGYAPDDFVIGCIGRIDPMKGHSVLLAALAALPMTNRCRLWIVGTHSEEWKRSYLAQAEGLGVDQRVRISGPRFDLRAVYNATDLIVSPSIFGEGFSNVVGEALACGRPVVATDVGDSARIIEGFGISVPPGDVDALAAAIERLMTRPGAAAASDRHAHVVSSYSVSRLVDRTAQLIEELCRP